MADGDELDEGRALADLCDEFEGRVRVVDASVPFRDFGASRVFHGEIETVKCFEDNSFVKSVLSEPGHNKVLVVDGGASPRRALVGDQIASAAARNGWRGVVVYGFVRDSAILAGIDLGVKALGCVPLKTLKKNVGERGIELFFGGVSFRPGNFVYCDSDGIVVSDSKL